MMQRGPGSKTRRQDEEKEGKDEEEK